MKPVLCDIWYAKEMPALMEPFEAYCAEKLGAGLSKLLLRFLPLRALLMLFFSPRFQAVAPRWSKYGKLCCVLQALLPRRSVVVLDVIDYDASHYSAPRRLLYHLISHYVLGPCMRRSVLSVRVMTEWEAELINARYGIDKSRIQYVRWPLIGWSERNAFVMPTKNHGMVFSSGRASCDWKTLFTAAEAGGWKLVVVCAAADLDDVKRLNKTVNATIHCEISPLEHDRLLASAEVCVICLKEDQKSSGQIRIGSCIELHVPIVASGVRGLDGYAVDNVTVMAFTPGDVRGLIDKTNYLLNTPSACQALTERALQYAKQFNKTDMLVQIAAFIGGQIAENNRDRLPSGS
jgi:hypothetical protein